MKISNKSKNDNLNSFWKKTLKNEPISKHTTLGIGGPAKYFIEVEGVQTLVSAVNQATKNGIDYTVIGKGSDLLVSDRGYDGLLIVNNVTEIRNITNRFKVSSGTILQDFINYVIDKGFAGIEKLSGIPGTVGGAIFGNAGAYGQTISDHINKVSFLSGSKKKDLTSSECLFEYRSSIFKKDKLVILEAEFIFERGEKEFLKKISLDTIQLRSQKYGPGIKCPGSFFKNILVQDLKPSVLKKISPDKISYGKIPAGYLLEEVGAKGAIKGGVKIADYHGNLIINIGNGTSEDFIYLANKYAKKVEDKFGIKLVPEVQLLGFEENE